MKIQNSLRPELRTRAKFKIQSLQMGQALLEILVALALGVTIATAFVSLGAISVRNSRFATDQVTATKLAQEGIEAMLSIRDQNIDDSVLNYSSGTKWTDLVGDSFLFCSTDPTVSCPSVDFKLHPQDAQCSIQWCLDHGSPTVEAKTFNNTNFSRKVRITDSTTNNVKNVTVFVYWTDGKGVHTSALTRKLGGNRLE